MAEHNNRHDHHHNTHIQPQRNGHNSSNIHSHNNANVISNKEGSGILIRTLQKGRDDDRRCAKLGDSCLVHYQGFFEDGKTRIEGCSSSSLSPGSSLYDNDDPLRQGESSSPPQRPLRFTVGEQEVIEGMDVAVQHMTVGQVVEITIPHRYAYGTGGYPPHIPPKATLVFRMELLDIQDKTHHHHTTRTRPADGNSFWL